MIYDLLSFCHKIHKKKSTQIVERVSVTDFSSYYDPYNKVVYFLYKKLKVLYTKKISINSNKKEKHLKI